MTNPTKLDLLAHLESIDYLECVCILRETDNHVVAFDKEGLAIAWRWFDQTTDGWHYGIEYRKHEHKA